LANDTPNTRPKSANSSGEVKPSSAAALRPAAISTGEPSAEAISLLIRALEVNNASFVCDTILANAVAVLSEYLSISSSDIFCLDI